MELGSWSDAQMTCDGDGDDDGDGSHLWSINSHEEFYQIYTKKIESLKTAFLRKSIIDNTGSIFDPRFSPHFFIGLVQSNRRRSQTIKVR